MVFVSEWTYAESQRFESVEYSPPQAATSTSARPGSIEKIQVMRQRVERGESVFHESDATDPIIAERRPFKELKSA